MSCKIVVFAGYPELAFLYESGGCNIDIDGNFENKKWGCHEYVVAAGRHRIEVSYPYRWSERCGANSVDIDMRDGETVHVYYFARFMRFFRGKIRVEIKDAPAR